MARPTKTGLDYFQMDVDTDDKFELIEAKHELIGFAIVVKLYQRIYKSGYFIDWNEEMLLIFKKSINVDINTINVVINDCLKYGIFDKILYEKYSILTSSGIQKRFIAACDRRKSLELIKEYIIVDINSINVTITWVNAYISTQSKVKESKEKEREREEENLLPPEIQKRVSENSEKELNDVFIEISKDKRWVETICMNFQLKSKDKVLDYLEQFMKKLLNEGTDKKSIKDTKSHFARWLNLQIYEKPVKSA